MYLLTVLPCFFNLVFLCLFIQILPIRLHVLYLTVIFFLVVSFVAAVVVFYEVLVYNVPCNVTLYTWLEVAGLEVRWNFLFDSVSVVLIIIVLFISLLVHIYSLEYMSGDPHILRFLFNLSLFTFFMLIMVTAGNALQLFLGWEGVGLASYLLINFWYSRSEANKSAIKAIVVNRIGDFGIYLAILLLFFVFNTLDFGIIFNSSSGNENMFMEIAGYKIPVLTLIASFIFLGTVGKSAQIGLHMWLPDAMEGPTPVSALLHAATMVTAGVFVFIRFSHIFILSPKLLLFVSVLGMLTTFLASGFALIQYDIKKIIAYSTCSHLGIMLFIGGCSFFNFALFHLFIHAFFKALLFLSAGAIIHALKDEQDIRKMGGLAFVLPFTFTMFLVGSLSLVGFPFLSGYFSKDAIWEIFAISFVQNFSGLGSPETHPFFTWFFLFSMFIIVVLSTAYSIRMLYFVFMRNYNGFFMPKINEPGLLMLGPMLVLALLSIFAGFFFKDIFIGFGGVSFTNGLPGFTLSKGFQLIGFQESFVKYLQEFFPGYFLFWLCVTFLASLAFSILFFSRSYFGKKITRKVDGDGQGHNKKEPHDGEEGRFNPNTVYLSLIYEFFVILYFVSLFLNFFIRLYRGTLKMSLFHFGMVVILTFVLVYIVPVFFSWVWNSFLEEWLINYSPYKWRALMNLLVVWRCKIILALKRYNSFFYWETREYTGPWSEFSHITYERPFLRVPLKNPLVRDLSLDLGLIRFGGGFCDILLSLRKFWNFEQFEVIVKEKIGNLMQLKRYRYVFWVSLITSDHILYRFISRIVLYFSHHISFKLIDRGYLEKFGPFGISAAFEDLFEKVMFFVVNNKILSAVIFIVFCFVIFGLIYLFFGLIDTIFSFFVFIGVLILIFLRMIR